jgi:hypothetical protein
VSTVELARPVLARWQRLRLVYNALVAALTVLLLAGLQDELTFPDTGTTVTYLAVGAVLANICFTAGPAFEIGLRRLGLRTRALTPLLFAAGVLVSVPLVFAFVLGTFRWTIG